MATVKVISDLTLNGLNPFTTNKLKTLYGKKIRNSRAYNDWKIIVNSMLPETFLPNDLTNYSLGFEMGVIHSFDLDNTLKGIIDCLEDKYGFNDNQIGHLVAKKTVVKINEGEEHFVRIFLMDKIELDLSESRVIASELPDNISEANLIRDKAAEAN